MKFLNREILDNLREKGINPNSIVQDGKTEQLFYVNYVTKVREYLEEKLAEEYGVQPKNGSFLAERLQVVSESFAKRARAIFKLKKGNYERSVNQNFFKQFTSFKLRRNRSMSPRKKFKKFSDLGKSQKYERAKQVNAAASGDSELLAFATSIAKDFDMNKAFVVKKMEKDPELAAALRKYIEKDIGNSVIHQSCTILMDQMLHTKQGILLYYVHIFFLYTLVYKYQF